jgi:hypothetical protein
MCTTATSGSKRLSLAELARLTSASTELTASRMRRWVGRGVVREDKDSVTREIYYALIEDQKTYAAEVSAVQSLEHFNL